MSATKFLKREFTVTLHTVGGLSQIRIIGSLGGEIRKIDAAEDMANIFNKLEMHCKGTIDDINGIE